MPLAHSQSIDGESHVVEEPDECALSNGGELRAPPKGSVQGDHRPSIGLVGESGCLRIMIGPPGTGSAAGRCPPDRESGLGKRSIAPPEQARHCADRLEIRRAGWPRRSPLGEQRRSSMTIARPPHDVGGISSLLS